MDRAMSNIESMPGGFNALRQFHSSMQASAAAGAGAGVVPGWQQRLEAGAACTWPAAACVLPASTPRACLRRWAARLPRLRAAAGGGSQRGAGSRGGQPVCRAVPAGQRRRRAAAGGRRRRPQRGAAAQPLGRGRRRRRGRRGGARPGRPGRPGRHGRGGNAAGVRGRAGFWCWVRCQPLDLPSITRGPRALPQPRPLPVLRAPCCLPPCS